MARTTHAQNKFPWSQSWGSTVFVFFASNGSFQNLFIFIYACGILGYHTQRPGWYFVHVQDYLNLRMFECIFSLDVAHIEQTQQKRVNLMIVLLASEGSLFVEFMHAFLNYFVHLHDYYNQTKRMRRLIWIFVWRTCPKVFFLRCGLHHFTLHPYMRVLMSVCGG